MASPLPPGTAAGGSPHELWVDGLDASAATIVSFTGRESLSKLYRFDVRLMVDASVDLLSLDLLGAEARLTMLDALAPRYAKGIVARVTPEGETTATGLRYWNVRVVPLLWLSKQRVASRVYQDLTVPEIAATLLGDVIGIPFRIVTGDAHPKRSYCVQYFESDYHFLKRILAEAGIFWFFEHGETSDGGETLVLADGVDGYAPLKLDYSKSSGRGDTLVLPDRLGKRTVASMRGELSQFERGHDTRPNQLTLRDRDYRNPRLELRESARSGSVDEQDATVLSIDAFRGDDDQPDVTAARARIRLEQLRSGAVVAKGVSYCTNLVPGLRFQLEAESAEHLNRGYVVTSVRHVGDSMGNSTDAYRAEFECVPDDVPFRPKRPKRRQVQVLESATVVGPPDHAVFTDALGRIKVQFHWDDQGVMDESSSCWVRVLQTWAGSTWGSQFIPRVGMEVMVSFQGADPDCPVVLGTVYNGTHPPPFPLPTGDAKSGFRTRSVPGGGGFHELSFDDTAGEEMLFVRAQRDHHVQVEHDQKTVVLHNQTTSVGSQVNIVEHDQTERVSGDAERSVEGDEKQRVEGSRSAAIEGGVKTSIGEDHRVDIGGAERRTVERTSYLKAGDDVTRETAGHLATIVGKDDALRSLALHVEGTTHMRSREITEISSPKGIRLVCGDSIIELSPDQVQIVSPRIVTRSTGARIEVDDDQVFVHAQKDVVTKGETVILKGATASVKLRSAVELDGTEILLCSPASAKDPVEEPEREMTTIELTDDDGNPRAFQRFILEFEDGSEQSGFLDENGHAELYLEKAANVRFPGMLEVEKG